jgi:hypothetical protein
MDFKKLNDPKNNIERDELHYDLWASFNDPKDVSDCEVVMARIFMDTLGVDMDDEYLIKFTAESKHFGNLCVHFFRRLNKEYPGLISMDTCDKFIDED